MALQQSNRTPNRILDAIYTYAEQEAHVKITNPLAYDKKYNAALKLEYYSALLKATKKRTKEEKISAKYVRHEIRQLKSTTRGYLPQRLLYSRPVDTVTKFLKGNYKKYKAIGGDIQKLQKQKIEEYNFSYLTNELQQRGFTFSMEGTLKKMLSSGMNKFHFRYADILNSNTDYVLFFEKIAGTELYHFKKYDAISRPSLNGVLDRQVEPIRHSFTEDFNARQASALVNQKAVFIDSGQGGNWVSLDFNNRGANGEAQIRSHDFNIEAALKALPVQPSLTSSATAKLLNSLKNGLRKEITLLQGETPVKVMVEASPQTATLKLFDQQGRPIQMQDTRKRTQELAKKLAHRDLGQDSITPKINTHLRH